MSSKYLILYLTPTHGNQLDMLHGRYTRRVFDQFFLSVTAKLLKVAEDYLDSLDMSLKRRRPSLEVHAQPVHSDLQKDRAAFTALCT